ncbi:Leucine Rich repeats (2 copies) [Planctomycetes bacterium CA13]|uniref:Leucine Rich repeats (2 copies) n=1 Tax=Novipirellula herctigrandis TaxID=2527986 RepID=A0A5C5ZBT6_9BACT|nr:Leucine Rich repeats (2 copies) [Planctomycetes bacterium CA13]
MGQDKLDFKNMGWRESAVVVLVLMVPVAGGVWYSSGTPTQRTSKSRSSPPSKETTVLDLRTDDQIDQDVAIAMELPKLKGIVMRGAGVTREHIQTLSQHPSLKMIVLCDTDLHDVDLGLDDGSEVDVQFCDQKPIKHLEQIRARLVKPYGKSWLMSGRYPDIGRSLVRMASFREVERVDMRNCVVSRETVESCQRFAGLKNLFVGYGFDDSQVELLMPIKSLEHLDLSQSMVTDQGIKHVAQLPKLKILTLGPNMGDESLRILAGCQTLEVLHCGFSQVGDAGIDALAESNSIRGLDLGGRPITGRSLDSLGKYAKLRDLAFSHDENIEYEDYQKLANIRELKRLYAPLPQSIRTSLQRSNPGLQVTVPLPFGG